MLRLRPTTLSLTMVEVEELDQRLKERKHHRQFLDYLTRPGDASEIPEFVPNMPSTSSAKARGKQAQIDQNIRFMSPSNRPEPERSTESESPNLANAQRDRGATFTLPDRTRRVDAPHRRSTKEAHPLELDGQPPSPPQQPLRTTPRRDPVAEYDTVDSGPSLSRDPPGPSPASAPGGAHTGSPSPPYGQQTPERTPVSSSGRRTFRRLVEPTIWPSSPPHYASASTPTTRSAAGGTLGSLDGADKRQNNPGPSMSPPRRPSATIPRHRIRPRDTGTREPTTPRRAVSPPAFEIYDDSLPSSVQPQTPQNLPEAQHQSRLRGSYTVPTRRGTSPQPRIEPLLTSRRRRRERDGRVPSPPGLQTPGMMGLYGGLENTDDVTLFEQAIRRTMRHMDGSPGPSL
ncbi:hypothetical protein B0T21DRAFT_412861 [Apiosordaria backusii]|uniref:Uncharacterized protein n=1 Tax=Apiosordaria backusii TaxID=314023 RepID=A0AA40EBZ9_9PEZI|nr:hypothetical protein B0T21DRAFT_412861 [Apiosordaria backusii]